ILVEEAVDEDAGNAAELGQFAEALAVGVEVLGYLREVAERGFASVVAVAGILALAHDDVGTAEGEEGRGVGRVLRDEGDDEDAVVAGLGLVEIVGEIAGRFEVAAAALEHENEDVA